MTTSSSVEQSLCRDAHVSRAQMEGNQAASNKVANSGSEAAILPQHFRGLQPSGLGALLQQTPAITEPSSEG